MGVGGEICVLAKDVFRALIFIQLHQEALLANLDVERIVDLCAVEVSGQRIGLAEWGHSQIDKRSLHAMTAESARLASGLPNLGRKCHRRHAFLRSFGYRIRQLPSSRLARLRLSAKPYLKLTSMSQCAYSSGRCGLTVVSHPIEVVFWIQKSYRHKG